MINKNKQIKLKFNGKEYVLEYDRDSIRIMEASGLNVLDLMRRPMTDISIMFEGAFLKHHAKDTVPVWEIYDSLKDKAGLNRTLVAMCQEVFTAMTAEPDEKNAVSWTVV